MNKILQFFMLLFLFNTVSCQYEKEVHLVSPVIPRPNVIYPVSSSFYINNETTIVLKNDEENMRNLADKFQKMIETKLDFDIPVLRIEDARDLKNVIVLSYSDAVTKVGEQGYSIEVDKDKVSVEGKDFEGAFNGVLTLVQIILLNDVNNEKKKAIIPQIQIWDDPSFLYRGIHLDVGRHFFSVDFIKKYLDIMALYKFNYFHWHLTEDQGWRIEIKAYPKLTEIGAWRTERDGKRYGGFYTQEQIKEVVAYAKGLNITVIPEIEMPGHSRAALAAYPQFSCTGKQQLVPHRWGVFEDVYCAGNEETFEFLETVLYEVMTLFPSEYIHIGGDESPKARWEKCTKCQARIKEENLENEHQLQSYFIQRIEKYLNAHGRKLIGWDEILEGGLAADATVMSWRGMQGGIDAANENHHVIMTPGDYCYFDHYQADPEFEPKAIGGYLPLSKVYEFNPIPEELKADKAKYIWGGQANMWTEYMDNTDYVEYMLLPRMLALSEALWTKKRNKNFEDFNERLQSHKKLLRALGYNYSNGTYRLGVKTEYDTTINTNNIIFKSDQYQPEIRYTTNDLIVLDSGMIYKKPFSPEGSCTITAGIFENGKLQTKATIFEYVKHLALGKELKLNENPHRKYGGNLKNGLIDGILGSDNFRDGKWSGFHASDLKAEINMQEETDVQELSFSYIYDDNAWVLPPKGISVFAKYHVEEPYQLIGEMDLSSLIDEEGVKHGYVNMLINTKGVTDLKVKIQAYQLLPSEHAYAGNKCWLFIDELIIK